MERLTPSDLRSIDVGEYIVIKHPDDCDYYSAEGEVSHVERLNSGATIVSLGVGNNLHIPSDARRGMTFDGRAAGADSLPVRTVHRRRVSPL